MNHVGSKSIFYADSQHRLNQAITSIKFTVRVDMPHKQIQPTLRLTSVYPKKLLFNCRR